MAGSQHKEKIMEQFLEYKDTGIHADLAAIIALVTGYAKAKLNEDEFSTFKIMFHETFNVLMGRSKDYPLPPEYDSRLN